VVNPYARSVPAEFGDQGSIFDKTTTRRTSINAYNKIKTGGLLSRMRMTVLDAIYRSAPCTSGEAFASMMTSSNQLSQSRARFTELREWGVIEEVGERPCKISGHNAIVWDLTGELPVKPAKKLKQKVCSCCGGTGLEP